MKIAHCVFFAKVGSKYCEVLIKPSKMLKTVKIMTKWQKFAQTDHKVHRKNLLRKGESVSQGPFLSHPPPKCAYDALIWNILCIPALANNNC